MKKSYQIEGMSCEDCVNTVQHALLEIPGVEYAFVQLKPSTAMITMHDPIATEVLQAKLRKAGNYIIKAAQRIGVK